MYTNLEIPEDKMTPLERRKSYLKGEEVDRLPSNASMSEEGALLIGKSVPDYLFDDEVMVETELFKIRELKFEAVSINLTLRGLGECLGSEIEYPKKRAAKVIEPMLKDYSILEALDDINPYKDGRAPIILSGIDKLKSKVNEFCPVGCGIPGPLTAAHAIRGDVQILKDMIKDPENFNKLMKYIVRNLLIFVEAMYKKNSVVCGIADPMVSTKLISPRAFEELVYPHLENLINGIIKITGSKPSLHICGTTKAIWPILTELNISSFSIDNVEDVEEAKHAFGNKCVISGNVDPVSIITYGSIENIFEETKKCIVKGHDSPCGYFVGSGCSIPGSASVQNIRAISEATRYFTQGFSKGVKQII